ncbi:hypothetical protein [Nocardia thailandica]|uniref:Tc toxin complex TcA C-terminal TcB-binding domain-containing protein n=1 Tax=Nocardia thailandica TaxID=257275 RepID=A0ABW6PV45_9NOCA|nr:hypothetical protein [Nocardia thailandica]
MGHPIEHVPAEPAGPARPLTAAARHVYKATLVPIATGGRAERGDAVLKQRTIDRLALTPGETDAVLDHLRAGVRRVEGPRVSDDTAAVLRAFEDPAVPAFRPVAADVGSIPASELATFGAALVAVRTAALAGGPQQLRAGRPEGQRGDGVLELRVNDAVAAMRGFAVNRAVDPIGMLNLERLEMSPAGIERGELVGTIPLAPGERTAVTHKEWSVVSSEFTTIVTDSLEDYSETGVTETTELAQSTTSQAQHGNQFNITGTVQGGIPIISGSTTTSFGGQDASSASATESTRHASEITGKASSRSRTEHKTTISTKTETGTEETSTRMLENTGADPVRVDYFSLLRTWDVRLYRYGLRLTYDLVVPEPAAAMRQSYAQLEWLRGRLAPFRFEVTQSKVTRANYQALADQWGTTVPPYPADPPVLTPSGSRPSGGGWYFLDLEFDVPPGAVVTEIFVDTQIGAQPGKGINFEVKGARLGANWSGIGTALILRQELLVDDDGTPFLRGATGHQKVTVFTHGAQEVWVGFTVRTAWTGETLERWRNAVWEALHTAAQTRYYAEQTDIAGRIRELEERLAGVDTLTLRREENDEIMKAVLQFFVGNGFHFMPEAVALFFRMRGVDVTHGTAFDGTADPVRGTAVQWAPVREYEDIVRFVNQAIEWENVVTFLYSYFWDLPESWNFVRSLTHPDKTRQAFLRAGSARVVLTVRKGWETAWVRFVQDGVIGGGGGGNDSPYLTIAREIAAYDDRNYPGIAPANPARRAVRLADAVYTTSSAVVAPGAEVIEVEATDRFVVGLPVVIDTADARGVQEAPTVTAIVDDTHLAVTALRFGHDGLTEPFPVLQPGARGALIAEWREYTPSSGIDIAMTSNLTTIV